MKSIKKILSILLVVMIVIGCVACGGDTSEESSNTVESVDLEEMTGSQKVDYFIRQGKDNYEAVKDDKNDLADLGLQYIKDISKYVENETQFDNDANMEDIMTKGGFLYQYGKDTMDILENAGKQESKEYSTAKLLNELGTDSIQMVKYVYREIEKPDDSATISNIKQVKKNIEGLQ